jgi:4-hydroxybutyryl-CoA dehydratase/vinylacetyl-CoA-Delta-isomerase
MFANGQHEASKLLADITGGVTCTVFNYKDWMNPEERPYLDKYLAAREGVPTEHRLKAIRLAKDITGHHHDVLAIHAEGSLAAQKMAIYASADWEKYKAIAKRIAQIPGWEKHAFTKDLPPWPAQWVTKI